MLKYIILLLMVSTTVSAEQITDCDTNRVDELYCAACNIYHEARGEGVEGMEAVAWIMLNRRNDERFPTNACDIVWENTHGHPEFAWTEDGSPDYVYNRTAWDDSIRLAYDVMGAGSDDLDMSDDPTMGAIFYHNDTIEGGGWWKTLIVTNTIGNHRFYVDEVNDY